MLRFNNCWKAVFAIGANLEFGISNSLPWRFQEDVDFFRDTISGGIVVGGRAIDPIRRYLSKYAEVVRLSRQDTSSIDKLHKLNLIKSQNVFIIGGKEILTWLMPFCREALVTHIHANFIDADCFFDTSCLLQYFGGGELMASCWCKNTISNAGNDAVRLDWKRYVRKDVPSPCIKSCEVRKGFCVGCNRSALQITSWGKLTDQEKLQIWDTI